jgi:cytochrome c2
MVAWLRNPQRIVPGNAMPDMGMSEADAPRRRGVSRHVALS